MRAARIAILLGFCIGGFARADESTAMPAPPSTPPSASALTLVGALKRALEKSPEYSISKAQRDNAADLVRNARAQLLPSLDLNANVGASDYRGNFPRQPWVSGASGTITEKLYDNGTTLIQRSKAKVDRDVAELDFQRVRDQLILNVVSAYYSYVLAERVAGIRVEQRQLAEKQLRTASALYRQGLRVKRDYLRFEVEAQRSEIDMRQARITSQAALNTLRSAIGEPASDESIQFVVIEPDISPEQLPSAPLDPKQTYQHRLAEMRSKLPDFQRDLAVRQYWPTFDLTAGGSYGSSSFLGKNANWNQNETGHVGAMLTMTYNLWDWGQRRRNVAIADRNNSIATEAFRRATLDATTATLKSALDLQQLRNTLQLSANLVQAQKEVFDALNVGFQEGKAQPVDLITGFRDLLDARLRLITARNDASVGVLNYRFLETTLAKQFPLEGE